MDKKSIIGLFDQYQTAQNLKKLLLDIGYEDFDISIIDGNSFKTEHFASTFGPLKGITEENLHHKIVHLGFEATLAREYETSLKEGYSLLAINLEEEDIDSILKIFSQFNASDIQISD